MKPAYRDILALANGKGVEWWDDNGVPRFAPFEPGLLGVYDDFAVLVEIECQSDYCHQRFLVGAGAKRLNIYPSRVVETTLESFAMSYDYGDPPRHDAPGGSGRCAGETMSSGAVRVVEAWERVDLAWVRRPQFEGHFAGYEDGEVR